MPSAKKKKEGKGKQRKAAAAAAAAELRKCDGCGKPPHPGEDLLCCTRCESAYYHDESCQGRHFPTHKGQCRRKTSSTDDGSDVKMCDGCGLPPRPGEKLVYCGKCDTAAYHGRECQLKHFKEGHKEECAKIAKRNEYFRPAEFDGVAMPNLLESLEINLADLSLDDNDNDDDDDDDDDLPPFVKLEEREGRGRCVVAREDLPVGAHPLQSFICADENCLGDHGWLESLVPPVVDSTYSLWCCSLCFQPVNRNIQFDAETQAALVHVYCSVECRERDPNATLESLANAKMISLGGRLPDAHTVLMSRVIRYSKRFPQVARDFDALSCNIEDMTNAERATLLMSLHNCHIYLGLFGGSIAKNSVKWLDKFYQINPADELEAFEDDIVWACKFYQNFREVSARHISGFGIFPQVSMMNHSCEPNSIATYFFRENNFPAIQVTTYAPVKSGSELTIDYLDKVNTPRFVTAERQRYLWDLYKFTCKCSRCLDYEADDILTGFLCPRRGCDGAVISHLKEAVGDDGRQPERQYICDTCGHSKFDKQSRWQKKILERAEEFEPASSSMKTGKDRVLSSYELAKKDFHRRSRIIALVGHSFVSCCARYFEHEKDGVGATEKEKEKRCRQIVEVMEYSRGAMKLCYKGRIDWPFLKLFEAQARLYLDHEDSRAVADLHAAREELNLFHPDTNKFIFRWDDMGAIHVPKCVCTECNES